MLEVLASWRSGDAEDCKSSHPGSIPGEASKIRFRQNPFRGRVVHRSRAPGANLPQILNAEIANNWFPFTCR